MYTCYRTGMEVTITQFRKQLFTLVDQAMQGTEVWGSPRAAGSNSPPEDHTPAVSKFDRITPIKIINDDVPESRLYEVMSKELEKDWDEQF